MASPSWSMYMPNFLPQTQFMPPTTLSKHELLAVQRQELQAKELEVENKTQALNLITGRYDAEIRSAAPSERSSRVRPS